MLRAYYIFLNSALLYLMAQNQPHGKADDGLGGPRPHRSLSAQDIPADRGALPDPTF